MKKLIVNFCCLFILASLIFSIRGSGQAAPVHQGDQTWSPFENISLTDTSSTYPTAVGDRSGNVHVFWVEDSGGETNKLRFNSDGTPDLDYRGKQINMLTDSGNTLSYTRWNGKRWVSPTEVQVSAGGRLNFPSATVDSDGMLHAIWFAGLNREQDMWYSRAPANQADQVKSWSHPVIITGEILTAYYPASIQSTSTGELHILYYQVRPNPGVFVISSFDGGDTWDNPVQVYENYSLTGEEDGSMPVRLMVDDNDRLHATWTRYDLSGNGKAIYYSQSLDQGNTWSEPFEVAIWTNGLYEMDWLSVGVAGDEIHLTWEGGERAFQNERISYDGGKTWTPAQRIMNRLVGENGWADIVTDSNNKLHMITVKRIDGNGIIVYGPWYSTQINGQWAIPILIGISDVNLYAQINNVDSRAVTSLLQGTILGDGLRYQQSVIVNGNELFVILVNEHDGEIYSSRLLLDAPQVAPEIYNIPHETATIEATPLKPTQSPSAMETPAYSTDPEVFSETMLQKSIYLSLVPVLVLIFGTVTYFVLLRRK